MVFQKPNVADQREQDVSTNQPEQVERSPEEVAERLREIFHAELGERVRKRQINPHDDGHPTLCKEDVQAALDAFLRRLAESTEQVEGCGGSGKLFINADPWLEVEDCPGCPDCSPEPEDTAPAQPLEEVARWRVDEEGNDYRDDENGTYVYASDFEVALAEAEKRVEKEFVRAELAGGERDYLRSLVEDLRKRVEQAEERADSLEKRLGEIVDREYRDLIGEAGDITAAEQIKADLRAALDTEDSSSYFVGAQPPAGHSPALRQQEDVAGQPSAEKTDG